MKSKFNRFAILPVYLCLILMIIFLNGCGSVFEPVKVYEYVTDNQEYNYAYKMENKHLYKEGMWGCLYPVRDLNGNEMIYEDGMILDGYALAQWNYWTPLCVFDDDHFYVYFPKRET